MVDRGGAKACLEHLFGSCRRAAPSVLGPKNVITADGPARGRGGPARRHPPQERFRLDRWTVLQPGVLTDS